MTHFKNIFTIIYFFSIHIAFCQKEDNIWMLGSQPSGNNIQLNFSTASPDTSIIFSPLTFFLSDVSICDSVGQLLFYSNGINIYNRNYDSLLNTTGFNPGWATINYANSGMGMVQPMVIIRNPVDYNKYYIFHESAEYLSNGETQPMNLSYSEIDMNPDNGLGGITSKKNIHVINDTLVFGKVTACRHANGRDWWIISHKYNSDLYYKVLVLPDTILISQQHIGTIIPDISDVYGQICFSPNGEKLAFAIQNNNIDIMGFDRCNGNLSLIETVSTPDTNIGIAGCSISPNSQFLYVNNEINLYQYDLTASNIAFSRYWIATWDSFTDGLQTYFFLNQLASNNKIYISTFNGTSYLHILDQPDQQGLACNFIQHGLKLPTYNIALPSFPNYRLGALTGSICDTLHIGINELTKKNRIINVFPNPAINKFTITFNLLEFSKGELVIYDITGRVVMYAFMNIYQSQQEINIAELTNGFYSCKLMADDNQVGEFKLLILKK